MKINKKGQLSGIAWIPAFVIVFFIMLLFVIFSAGLYTRRNMPFIGDSDELLLEEGEGNLIETKKLYGFLSTFVEVEGDSKKIYEMILDYHRYNKEYEEELEEQSYLLDYLTYKTDTPLGGPLGGESVIGYNVFSYTSPLTKFSIRSESFDGTYHIMEKGGNPRVFAKFVLFTEKEIKIELTKSGKNIDKFK